MNYVKSAAKPRLKESKSLPTTCLKCIFKRRLTLKRFLPIAIPQCTIPAEYYSGTSASKPMDDCLDLSTENLMTAIAVFPGPGLPTPPRLAPIWRAPDVVPEPHLTKPATSGVKNGVAMGTLTGNEAAPTDNRPSELEAAHSEPNAKPEFMCTICFKILASKSSLDTHTKSIHENRKFPCTDCGKRFFDRSTLRRHKKCIHENITHRCKFCSLEFSRRHYLTSHVHKEHPNILQTNEQPGSNSVNLSLGGITGQVSPENCHKTKDNQKKETRSPGPEVSRHIIPGENHDHRKPSKREGNSLRNGISDLA